MTKLKFSLSLSLLIALCSVLIVFLMLPNYFEYQALSTEYSRKRIIDETRQSHFEFYEETHEQVLHLQTRIDEQLKRIQPLQNLNHLIVTLGISFSDYHLHETDFSVGRTIFFTPESTDFSVGKTTVTLSGVGTYENIMAFISHLHEAEEYYQIDTLLMSSENVLLEGSIFVKLEITIYAIKEEGEEEPPYVEQKALQNPFYHS